MHGEESSLNLSHRDVGGPSSTISVAGQKIAYSLSACSQSPARDPKEQSPPLSWQPHLRRPKLRSSRSGVQMDGSFAPACSSMLVTSHTSSTFTDNLFPIHVGLSMPSSRFLTRKLSFQRPSSVLLLQAVVQAMLTLKRNALCVPLYRHSRERLLLHCREANSSIRLTGCSLCSPGVPFLGQRERTIHSLAVHAEEDLAASGFASLSGHNNVSLDAWGIDVKLRRPPTLKMLNDRRHH